MKKDKKTNKTQYTAQKTNRFKAAEKLLNFIPGVIKVHV